MIESSIDLIKKARSVNTSESVFGLMEQPPENCPYIDESIKDLSLTGWNIIDEIRRSEIEDSILMYYATEIDGYKYNFEELRTRIETLRQWGEEWKQLAKGMFEDLTEEKQKEYI